MGAKIARCACHRTYDCPFITTRRRLDTDSYQVGPRRPFTKIGRIRDLQQRAVALTGTAIVATFISTGNVLGSLYYDVIQASPNLAGYIAAVAVGVVLLLCLVFAMCIRRMRK